MHFRFFFLIFIYLLFMAVLGLRFCARAFSSCGKRGPLFIAARGPLTIAASLVAKHRLQTRRLSNCGSRAQPLRGMWDLPRPGLEPVSPALAGRLSTTAPPGKPTLQIFQLILGIKIIYVYGKFSKSPEGYTTKRKTLSSHPKPTTVPRCPHYQQFTLCVYLWYCSGPTFPRNSSQRYQHISACRSTSFLVLIAFYSDFGSTLIYLTSPH